MIPIASAICAALSALFLSFPRQPAPFRARSDDRPRLRVLWQRQQQRSHQIALSLHGCLPSEGVTDAPFHGEVQSAEDLAR